MPKKNYPVDPEIRLRPDVDQVRGAEILAELNRSPRNVGSNMFKRYLGGNRLTARQSALAKCADCMCSFVDGLIDCHLKTCPLYPFMPYGQNRKNKKMSENEQTPGGEREKNAV